MAAARRRLLTGIASAKSVGEGGLQNAAYSPALLFTPSPFRERVRVRVEQRRSGMNREPAVAGSFYPGDGKELEESVHALMGEAEPCPALGVVSPHAGYMYSGPVAGALFGRIVVPDTCVILAPNHTGMGNSSFSVWPEGEWVMPMGNVPVDEQFCSKLLQSCDLAEPDESTHMKEHSAEVQIPFLQAANRGVRIVPVVISSGEVAPLRKFGKDLAGVIEGAQGQVLVVASSDMTHYESQESAREKDRMAIDMITALDEEGLLSTVSRNRITMCGVAPTAAMLACCKELGAKEAELVRYQTSGDITGDFLQVVGYAAIIVR